MAQQLRSPTQLPKDLNSIGPGLDSEHPHSE